MKIVLAGAALLAVAPRGVAAQAMPATPMPVPSTPARAMPAAQAKPPATPPAAGDPSHDMPTGAMAGMAGMPMNDMPMVGMRMGDGITAMGSGTSRLPAADAMPGLYVMAGDWALMAHGYAWASWDRQGGPRGATEAFVQSMAMLQASRPLSRTLDLTLRAMISADPLMGERGYPNLFATGETAHGLALVDRQHPHDLFMELSGRLDRRVGDGAVFLYAGLPGEPALGPAAFMHRGSARYDPEAPITHHWFDSTHITYGVVTIGYAAPHWQLEASAFKGREPDERRWDIETPRLDSWSVRATWNPSAHLSAQVSYGRLHSPEQLHPEQDDRRLIASASYSGHGVDATVGWSRKAIVGDRVLPAWFAEGTWQLSPRDAVFGRFERVRNDELFEADEQLGRPAPLAGRPFEVNKFTLGYARTVPLSPVLAIVPGVAASAYAKPQALDDTYGRRPHSVEAFAKLVFGRRAEG